MSTRGVTYGNGVIYFVLRIIFNTGFSIITNRNTVYRICFSIVTNCYRVITIMSSTITNGYTLSSLGNSLSTNGYTISKSFLISSCTCYNFCTLTDSNSTSSISLGITTSIIFCILSFFIIHERRRVSRTNRNRLIPCSQCRMTHSQACFSLCGCCCTDSRSIFCTCIGLTHHC